eukprot:3523044-Pleurochrysis_carterae.AAC.2
MARKCVEFAFHHIPASAGETILAGGNGVLSTLEEQLFGSLRKMSIALAVIFFWVVANGIIFYMSRTAITSGEVFLVIVTFGGILVQAMQTLSTSRSGAEKSIRDLRALRVFINVLIIIKAGQLFADLRLLSLSCTLRSEAYLSQEHLGMRFVPCSGPFTIQYAMCGMAYVVTSFIQVGQLLSDARHAFTTMHALR